MQKHIINESIPQMDWHPADIIAALRKAGVTLTGLAKAHGLRSSSAFSVALIRSYPVCEKRIADALNIHPMVIWPSRYEANGSIKPRGYREVQCNASERVSKGMPLTKPSPTDNRE